MCRLGRLSTSFRFFSLTTPPPKYETVAYSDMPQLDAGQHPAYDGLAALPFFDDFDLSTVDVLLISQ